MIDNLNKNNRHGWRLFRTDNFYAFRDTVLNVSSGSSAKGFINRIFSMILGCIDVIIPWQVKNPSALIAGYGNFSISHWRAGIGEAIFPCYSDYCTHIHSPFVGCVYDGGDIKDAHPSHTQTGKPVIVCGDLNVAATAMDIKNPKANIHNAGYTEEERGKFQQLLSSGFTDTYRHLYPDEIKYSWWSYRFNSRARNAGWRIDYFLTSNSLNNNLIDAKIHTDILGSDHCPVELDIDL